MDYTNKHVISCIREFNETICTCVLVKKALSLYNLNTAYMRLKSSIRMHSLIYTVTDKNKGTFYLIASRELHEHIDQCHLLFLLFL